MNANTITIIRNAQTICSYCCGITAVAAGWAAAHPERVGEDFAEALAFLATALVDYEGDTGPEGRDIVDSLLSKMDMAWQEAIEGMGPAERATYKDTIDKLTLSPEQAAAVAELERIDKLSYSRHCRKYEKQEKVMGALGFRHRCYDDWGEWHPTRHTIVIDGVAKPALCDDSGWLWGHVSLGWYAKTDIQLNGSGPLIDPGLIDKITTVQWWRCDCGYGGGALVPIWGSSWERHEARQVLIRELMGAPQIKEIWAAIENYGWAYEDHEFFGKERLKAEAARASLAKIMWKVGLEPE